MIWISTLPEALSEWQRTLCTAPLWQLADDTLVATEHAQDSAWLVAVGEALNPAALSQLGALLGEQRVSAVLYPLPEAARPTLLLGCDRFSPELVAALRERTFAFDVCHLRTLPTLAQPGLLVMDMDSTAIRIECIDEIARLAGVGEQVAAVTAAAMQGKLEFADSLRNRVALLEGAPVSILDEVAANMPWMPGLPELVETLKGAGWKVAIASGGFTRFAGELQRALGLDAIHANELAVAEGRLTGKVTGRIVDAAVKAEELTALGEQYGIALTQRVAVGDGANDLKMMAAAGLGIAIHAKPVVRAQAAASIEHHDLDGVLCLLQASRAATLRWTR